MFYFCHLKENNLLSKNDLNDIGIQNIFLRNAMNLNYLRNTKLHIHG